MSEKIGMTRRLDTGRQSTTYIEEGPPDGPLMIFVHGWPSIGLLWRHQISYFAERGWHCVAPDLRGHGGSSVFTRIADYSMREIVLDLVELHQSIGGQPALWIGHDWGCPPVWAMAAHHRYRCLGVVNLTVPYFARGFTLPNLIATVDRNFYPIEQYPAGQWDYWLYHREHAGPAAETLSADVRATVALFHLRTTADAIGKPAFFSDVRARGGFFGSADRAPSVPMDDTMLSTNDYESMVAALKRTGFRAANALYDNDVANAAFAAEAPDFGHLSLPSLFVHAEWDAVCNTVHSNLAVPMREDCANLSEVRMQAGHFLMLEQPTTLNEAIADWLRKQSPFPGP